MKTVSTLSYRVWPFCKPNVTDFFTVSGKTESGLPSGVFRGVKSLYSDDEIEIKPWFITFNYLEGSKGIIGYSIGAEMFPEDEPPEVDLIHNGWTLQVKTKFSPERLNLDMVYGPRMRKQQEIALDDKSTPEQRTQAFDKYAMLRARKTAELQAIEAIKDTKKDNYQYGFFQQALSVECSHIIDKPVIFGNVLSIDIAVKKTTKTYIESKVISKGSPSKV